MTFSRDHHPFFLPPNSSGRSNKAKQNRVSQNSAPPSCSNHFYHLLHLYLISSIFSLAETIEPSQTSKNHSPQARPSDIALVAGYLPTYLLRYYTNRHRRRIVSSPSVSDHDPLTLSPLSQCSKGHPVPPLLQTIRNDPRPPPFRNNHSRNPRLQRNTAFTLRENTSYLPIQLERRSIGLGKSVCHWEADFGRCRAC